MVTVPPHKGQQVIEDSELGAGGFIPTDKKKLNMEGRENVFVLGDTTNLPISKAGSTAFEAEALGENIALLFSKESQFVNMMEKCFALSRLVMEKLHMQCLTTIILQIRKHQHLVYIGLKPYNRMY